MSPRAAARVPRDGPARRRTSANPHVFVAPEDVVGCCADLRASCAPSNVARQPEAGSSRATFMPASTSRCQIDPFCTGRPSLRSGDHVAVGGEGGHRSGEVAEQAQDSSLPAPSASSSRRSSGRPSRSAAGSNVCTQRSAGLETSLVRPAARGLRQTSCRLAPLPVERPRARRRPTTSAICERPALCSRRRARFSSAFSPPIFARISNDLGRACSQGLSASFRGSQRTSSTSWVGRTCRRAAPSPSSGRLLATASIDVGDGLQLSTEPTA